jgi:hypothetical protein
MTPHSQAARIIRSKLDSCAPWSRLFLVQSLLPCVHTGKHEKFEVITAQAVLRPVQSRVME